MSNNTFVLGSGQAHELEMSFRRTGWDNAEVKVLCTGNNLALVRDLINGKLEYKHKQPLILATAKKFPTWKTVRIGTHKKLNSLRKDIEKNGFNIAYGCGSAGGFMTKELFYHFEKVTLAKEETMVDLVNISVGDLGFETTVLRNIYARAIESGLSLCLAEVGPQLRLQYADQPFGEKLHIAMETIYGADGGHHIFKVERNERGLWLCTEDTATATSIECYLWHSGDRFVFCKKK